VSHLDREEQDQPGEDLKRSEIPTQKGHGRLMVHRLPGTAMALILRIMQMTINKNDHFTMVRIQPKQDCGRLDN